MARARNIKPKFFQNDELGELNPLARLLFIGLWTVADFKGCLEYRPKRLKTQILPYDECSIEELASALDKSGFITIYSVLGQQYIKILKFKEHQNPHKNEKEGGSDCPDIDKKDNEISQLKEDGTTPDKNGTARADSLFPLPDSLLLNPDSGIPQPAEPPQPGKPETARAVTAADLSIAMRKFGMRTQPADPRLIALAEQGITPETVAAACEEAKQAKPNQRISLGYVVAILERWSADAAALKVAGASAPKSSGGAWWASDATILAKGLELNLKPLAGERMLDFKARIQAAIDNDGKPPAPAPTASIITPQKPIEPKGVKPEGMPSLKSFVKHAPGGSQ